MESCVNLYFNTHVKLYQIKDTTFLLKVHAHTVIVT